MGFFDFILSPKQDQASSTKKRPLTEQDERAAYENRELFAEKPQEKAAVASDPAVKEEPKGLIPTDEMKFLKERAQSRDFALKEAERAVDMALSTIDQRDPGIGEPADRKPFLTRLRTVPPEQYATEVEKILDELEPTVRGLGGKFNRGAILAGLENAVTNYKRLLDTPVQQQNAQRLAEQDRPNIQAQLDSKMKAVEELDQKMKYAATERQKQELLQDRQYYRSAAAALQQKLGVQEQPSVEPPPSAAPVTEYMKGLGIGKEDLTDRMHQAMQKVGIPADQWEDQVNTQAGVLRVASALSPDGEWARMVADSLAKARAEDAAAKEGLKQAEGQMAQTEQAIGSKEAQLRQLYGSLGGSEFMRTWPGIILYVLVGLLTQNPAFAARLIGGVRNRQAVDAEIKVIQADMRRLEIRLSRQQEDQQYWRREAAKRLQHKEDESQRRVWDLAKMMQQHKLILERNAAKSNPETSIMKKLSGEFNRAMGMAAKFSGEMQNEFADPTNRKKARDNFEFYMRQAAELDQQLKEIGGDVLDEETGEEQE